MGKILNGILGPVDGKIGSVVGFQWKGIPAIRSYAIPANPQTVGQQANRSVFSDLVFMGRALLSSVLQPYWDPFQTKMSGFNRFMQVNKIAMGSTYDDSLLKIAEGQLEVSGDFTSDYSTPNAIFNWTEAVSQNGELTDNVIAMVTTGPGGEYWISVGEATRDDEALNIPIGTGYESTDLHFYLAFYRGSGESLLVSNTEYALFT